jgi:uncharacterized membrane protein YphA (DoxX/SURF4 family)
VNVNVALWVVQGLLAVAYLFSGFMKVTQPIDQLGKQMMTWAPQVPSALVRFIGAAEILGAIGLIVPLATGIFPWLTIAAAIGLVAVQILAAGFHASRSELSKVPMNLVLLVLAAVVVFGRFA